MAKLKVAEKELPFEITAKGRLNLETNKVSLAKVATSDFEAVRFAYEVVKGACNFNEIEFKTDFNAFANKVEYGVFEKARQLAISLAPKPLPKKEAKVEPKK